jgi:AcrR family transcriptional regulator
VSYPDTSRNVLVVIGTGGMGLATARRLAGRRRLVLAEYCDTHLEAVLTALEGEERAVEGHLDAAATSKAHVVAKRGNHLRVQATAHSWPGKGAPLNTISPAVIAAPMGLAELKSPTAAHIQSMIHRCGAHRVGTRDGIACIPRFLADRIPGSSPATTSWSTAQRSPHSDGTQQHQPESCHPDASHRRSRDQHVAAAPLRRPRPDTPPPYEETTNTVPDRWTATGPLQSRNNPQNVLRLVELMSAVSAGNGVIATGPLVRAASDEGRLRWLVLNAATRLFGDFDGYRGTSLADIAHEIGYSKASVLYHFASKEALLAELIAPAAADLRALLARVSALPLAQARRSAIEGYVDLTVTHKETVAVLQTEEPLLAQDRHFQLYERLVGVLQGEDHNAQARVAAIMVVVGIAAACTERSDLTPEQLKPALVTVALRALGLPADSPPG